eukprot:TRINITY_DN838_c0_g1_i2.p1 TRINITY_DN838_c0_g1~~TRINITY_DN838_c0_g1_i2.p1  ORF type:complete len:101 (+),score=24.77 TRINITY_DN838_c0_g1_i2:7-309(+)
MSTAGRPTFNAALGGENRQQSGNKLLVPTKQISSRDLQSHTKIKVRQPGQGTKEEVKQRDLRTELEEKERKHTLKKQEDQLKLEGKLDEDEEQEKRTNSS